MTTAVFRKRGNSLIAVDDEGRELLMKLKDDRDVMVKVTKARSPRHHRLYWALVKFIQMHSPLFEGAPLEKIHVSLKLATGLVDTYVDYQTGKIAYVPRSTSWAAMDETEFSTWFDEAVGIVAQRWMPANTTPKAVRDELILMTDGPQAM